MVDLPLSPDRSPTTDRPPPTPRWVKVSGIIVIVLVLLVITMHLAGGLGNHFPPSSSVIEHGAPPP